MKLKFDFYDFQIYHLSAIFSSSLKNFIWYKEPSVLLISVCVHWQWHRTLKMFSRACLA